MQYSVPQFVDVEDKVIGPLTIKQFLWMLGGSGTSLVLWFVLPKVLAVIVIIPLILLSAAFAFYKVNGNPFYIYVANLFSFAIKPKTRVWKRDVDVKVEIPKEATKKEVKEPEKQQLSDVDLSRLVYTLDHELSNQARSKPVSNPVKNDDFNKSVPNQTKYDAPKLGDELLPPAPSLRPDLSQGADSPGQNAEEAGFARSLKPFRNN